MDRRELFLVKPASQQNRTRIFPASPRRVSDGGKQVAAGMLLAVALLAGVWAAGRLFPGGKDHQGVAPISLEPHGQKVSGPGRNKEASAATPPSVSSATGVSAKESISAAREGNPLAGSVPVAPLGKTASQPSAARTQPGPIEAPTRATPVPVAGPEMVAAAPPATSSPSITPEAEQAATPPVTSPPTVSVTSPPVETALAPASSPVSAAASIPTPAPRVFALNEPGPSSPVRPAFRLTPDAGQPEESASGTGLPDLSKAEAQSEQAAMRKYATLRSSRTLMSQLYRAHAEDLRKHFNPLLRSPKWPEALSDQCAREARAYLQPDFLSRTGNFTLLPDETFDGYHVRRQVMMRFNQEVVASADRNIARYPDADHPETPFAKKLKAKGVFLRQNQPVFFETPDWPERLTELCLKEDDQLAPEIGGVPLR